MTSSLGCLYHRRLTQGPSPSLSQQPDESREVHYVVLHQPQSEDPRPRTSRHSSTQLHSHIQLSKGRPCLLQQTWHRHLPPWRCCSVSDNVEFEHMLPWV